MEKYRLAYKINEQELFMNIDIESESLAIDEAHKIMTVLMQSGAFVRLLSINKI